MASDIQPFALTDGIANRTGMLPHYLAGCVQKITCWVFLTGITFHECSVITVWNKADILTVLLFGSHKTLRQGNFPYLCF
mgnify:CR=1 FL=1